MGVILTGDFDRSGQKEETFIPFRKKKMFFLTGMGAYHKTFSVS